MPDQTTPPDKLMRFSVLDRLLHLVLMFGFTGLAASGFSLGFSATAPARAFIWLVGGTAHAGWLHRFCAIITYSSVVIHGLWFLYFRFVLRGRLTGPRSIVPSKKDLKDFKQNMAYFLGWRPSPPDFDKFTYMEKIDYWAIFIGMNTMGITGLILWFPEWFTRFLPGVWVNIAQVLHYWEAILAVVVKLFIHVGMAHLRPTVYPVDTSIFSGRTTRERMMAEHPAEWRSIATDREKWTETK